MRDCDFTPEALTEQETEQGESFTVNHRGSAERALMVFGGLAVKMSRWAQNKKPFRVTIDYDPEWHLKVQFRQLTPAEAESMDRNKPTKDELDSYRELLRDADLQWSSLLADKRRK